MVNPLLSAFQKICQLVGEKSSFSTMLCDVIGDWSNHLAND